MLLTIDVGNTNIVLGLFEGKELKYFWRMETGTGKSADEYGASIRQLLRVDGLDLKDVDDVIISSVVPSLNYTLSHLSEKYFNRTPLFASTYMNLGFTIEYENPKALGADRIVNAAAAAVLYPGNVIIIDFGTATTYCALTKDKRYLGGVIQPGVKISADALFEKTSKLPRIEIIAPKKAIGKNTVECMESGVVLGAIGSTEYIIDKMKKEMDGDVTVIGTGGFSGLIAEHTDSIDIIDKQLTLKGLQILWEMNH